MTRRVLYSVILAAAFGVALTGAAQQTPAESSQAQPPLTFRVEANFVEVDAFVSDATGKAVIDLRATDFQLL